MGHDWRVGPRAYVARADGNTLSKDNASKYLAIWMTSTETTFTYQVNEPIATSHWSTGFLSAMMRRACGYGGGKVLGQVTPLTNP
ncbi:hypothetical protein [Vulcanisaeta sp. JCM 14467]|uniref:hypothetical protein n=1 Tax=Vulcanisaeta sp. JCM 14467 TaxID=1295370 RepID=UPI0020932766|nr:hypothetical protein [Vulcanisaeta sp. JCM 14467]